MRLASLFPLLLSLLLATGGAPAEAPPEPTVSAEEIRARIDRLQTAPDMAEDQRKKAVDAYKEALSTLERIKSLQASTEAFRKDRQEAGAEAQALRARLDELSGQDPLAPVRAVLGPDLGTEELKQILIKEDADRAAVKAKLDALDEEIAAQQERPAQIKEELEQAKRRKQKAAAALERLPVKVDDPLTEAQRLLLQLREQAAAAEILLLDQELLSHPMRLERLRARRDLTLRNLENITERVNFLKQTLNTRRQADAQAAVEQAQAAQAETAVRDPLLHELAKENARLTEEISRIVPQIRAVTEAQERVHAEAERFERKLASVREKLSVAGVSGHLGRLLQQEWRALGERARMPLLKDRDRPDFETLALQRIQHEEALRDLETTTRRMLESLPPERAGELAGELRKLMETRRELLRKVIELENAYLQALTDLELARQRMRAAVREYRAFLASHIVWIPDAEPLGWDDLQALPAAVRAVFAPAAWMAVLRDLPKGLQAAWWQVLLLGTIALVAAAFRRRLREHLNRIASAPSRAREGSLPYTLAGLGMTVALALPVPFALLALASALEAMPEPAPTLAPALAQALHRTAMALLHLLAFSRLVAPGGIAEGHFRWHAATLQRLRGNLRRMIPGIVPLAFVSVLFSSFEDGRFSAGAGRLVFLVLMAALSVFLGRILHPRKGAVAHYLSAHPEGWLNRTRYLWYLLVLLGPVAVFVLTWAGFIYTASVLTEGLAHTFWLLLTLIVLRDLTVRWLVVTQWRLARARSGQEGDEDLAEVDVGTLSEQTQRLAHTLLAMAGVIGLWIIWGDLLPALQVLDQIELWTATTTVGDKVSIDPVTLSDVLLTVTILALVWVAARNLPGLVEMVLLRQRTVDPGLRYTIVTLLRYVLVAAGLVLAFDLLGGRWSEIQWLIAALGVGLGFGLQEIVANFVSGLIILFERPIRVGDTITIGDTTGVVNKIRIRATTIETWDRQELLVPNKEFISSRLLNWSLSNPINRILIPVGVAYGTDVGRAMAILLQAAREHPKILGDPAPFVTFDDFGDNALILTLRAYLDDLNVRLGTATQLRETIYERLQEAGIGIAFPQRDVHLDTIRPLDVRILRDTDPQGTQPA
jgi:potassium efflux system protein